VICPNCQTTYAGTQVQRVRRGYVVDCPACGLVPWRAVLPHVAPLVIHHDALAAHRRSGESAQRRRWYDVALRRWLSGRNAPSLRGC
jgi:hypothetical protein